MIKAYLEEQEITSVNPLTVGPLNASDNQESDPIKVTLKCDLGYQTLGTTTVNFEGTTAAKWKVCDSQSGNYQASTTISTPITNVGKDIWVKAQATSDEMPTNDKTVKLKIQAVIQAVE